MGWEIITGDCRTTLGRPQPYADLLVVDPPYGDTSLGWDKRLADLFRFCDVLLKPCGSMWVFGSMRYFLDHGAEIRSAGFRYAQDIVWEKHNGSGFHADRFKRVHEHVVQFYRESAKWSDVYNQVQTTPDAVARTVKRKKGRPAHMGNIDAAPYASVDGGPRLMRSVLQVRSMHGRAIHPTEKPTELLEVLIRTSCPLDGIVCDPFAGSGAVGEAAIHLGRHYIGAEIDAAMAQKARDRLTHWPLKAA